MGIDLATAWELFHAAILAALLAGAVCPLVGALLLVRRTGFYGVALPQFAAAGVAAGYAALPYWVAAGGLGGLTLDAAYDSPHAIINYLLGWAWAATLGGLALLAAFGRRPETEAARVAAAFAVANALMILLAMRSPAGGETIATLLRGEVLAIDVHELESLAVVYGGVLLALLLFHRELVLVSYDPETARVVGVRPAPWEAVLLLLTGLTVALGTLLVGPVVLFGLLVVPPLAARASARSLGGYLRGSAALGVASAALGIVAAFALDWPLGPAIVVAACAVGAAGLGAARLARARRVRSAAAG